jgi:hypothetical protein
MRDFCGIAKDARPDYATNPKYIEGVIPEYQRRGTRSANSAEILNSSPLSASVDGDPAGFGTTGKGRLSRLRACFFIGTRTDQI